MQVEQLMDLGRAGRRPAAAVHDTLTLFSDGRVTPAVNITVAFPSVAAPVSVRCIRIAGLGAVSTTQGACS
jgi:hypothetical protein